MGMPGLALSTQSRSAAQRSVITSSQKNVHLDGGAQMVLRVNSQQQPRRDGWRLEGRAE